MKILFFGLGSIGTRHLNLIKENYNHKIYAYRSKKGNPAPDVTNIYNLEEALNINPDIVFITNPTHLHIETALMCLKKGVKKFFIEKPLSHGLENLDLFLKEVEKVDAYIYIGFDMRHNPILKRLKELVDERKEKIFYARTVCSSYLPNWRPGIDYRSVYSAKKAQGGGVILDLAHEFDYNEYLFGKVKTIDGIYGKISKLEIDSEDFCDVVLTFNNDLIATIHLDYFSCKDERFVKILTPTEEIIADFINKEIIIKNNEGERKEILTFEGNSVYKDQLEYFFDEIEGKSENRNKLRDTKELLEKMLEFKNKNEFIFF
jgi:predicted dehydrogenase